MPYLPMQVLLHMENDECVNVSLLCSKYTRPSDGLDHTIPVVHITHRILLEIMVFYSSVRLPSFGCC